MVALLQKRLDRRIKGSNLYNKYSFRSIPLKSITTFSEKNALYNGDYFRNMMVLERKRAERTNNEFMIVLIDVSLFASKNSNAHQVIENITNALSTNTRETDIKGWYTDRKVIGVIFTEYDPLYKDVIRQKVTKALDNALPLKLQKLVSVSWFNFPEDEKKGGKKAIDMNAMLYNSKVVNHSVASFSNVCKRGIDIIGSIVGIMLFSPFFIVIPIVIKCCSKGPVFFKQVRVGLYGQTFLCFKFRTMKVSNNADIHKEFMRNFIKNGDGTSNTTQKCTYKITNDPRVTWIGRFLRKSSLDELPQFFNVLLGHMSLVGPRPAISSEVEEYNLWHKRRVLEAKPGITGIWQVKGRSRTDFNNMVRMDIQYIQKRSPLLDLALIFKTPIAMFSAKGAY